MDEENRRAAGADEVTAAAAAPEAAEVDKTSEENASKNTMAAGEATAADAPEAAATATKDAMAEVIRLDHSADRGASGKESAADAVVSESAGGAGESPGGGTAGIESDTAENDTAEAAAGTNRRRGPLLLLGVISLILLCALIVVLFRQHSASGGYIPPLTVQGDVETVLTLQYDGKQYTASSGDRETADVLETKSFVFDGSKHRGIPLTSILDVSGLYAEECHIYLAGYDGMMSSLDVSQLAENYVLFTENGWEIMNVDWPPSCNVKGMEWIAAVADRPDEVEASVTVADDSGYERIVSPGTLLIMERTSALKFHGQSSNNGRDVSVFTTDSYVELGGTKLVLDGNRIVTE